MDDSQFYIEVNGQASIATKANITALALSNPFCPSLLPDTWRAGRSTEV